jgi:hypothetical protein
MTRYEQLLPQRESLGAELKELLSIIQRHHFNLVGGSLATIDGGPALDKFYKVPYNHIRFMRN